MDRWLVKYGATVSIPITFYTPAGDEIEPSPTLAAGDCKISKDGAADSNTTNLPAAVTGLGHELDLVVSETQAEEIVIHIIDQTATKTFLDHVIVLETYGHASAKFPYDPEDGVRIGLTALPNAAAGAAGGLPLGDANARVDVGEWLGQAVTAGVGNRPAVDAQAVSGSTTAADNVEANIGNLDAAVSTRAAASDLATVDTVVDAIKLQTDKITFDVSDRVIADAQAISASTAAADSVEANIGNLDVAVSTRAAAADLLASVADLLAQLDLIKLQTDKLQFDVGNRVAADAEAISASTAAADAVEANIGNLDAAVSDMATSANLVIVDTVVDAIKLQTDKLQFDVGNRVAADAEAISGSTLAANQVEANIGNLDAAVSGRSSQASVDTIDGIVDDILTDTSALDTRLTALRAGYLDNLDVGGLVASGSDLAVVDNICDALLVLVGSIDGKANSISTTVDAILVDTGALDTRLTALRAGYLDNLDIGGPVAKGTALSVVAADVDSILVDTDALDGRLTALRAGYLDNLAIGGLVADADAMAVVDANVDAILADTGTDGVVVNSFSAGGATALQTAVSNELDAAIAELGVAAPTATPTIRTALMLLYMALRNKSVATEDLFTIADDAGTVVAQAELSSTSTTFTREELGSG